MHVLLTHINLLRVYKHKVFENNGAHVQTWKGVWEKGAFEIALLACSQTFWHHRTAPQRKTSCKLVLGLTVKYAVKARIC